MAATVPRVSYKVLQAKMVGYLRGRNFPSDGRTAWVSSPPMMMFILTGQHQPSFDFLDVHLPTQLLICPSVCPVHSRVPPSSENLD